MKRRYLLLFALFLLAFGALFTLLSAGPPLPREEGTLEISVVTRESESAVWASIRQGMEQAANDLDLELRLVTLTEANNVDEQTALLTREIEGGADALILSPADPEPLSKVAASAAARLPIVAIESPVGSLPCITADNEAMGYALARELLPRLNGESRVLLLAIAPGEGGVALRQEGARKALASVGITCETALLSGTRPQMVEELTVLLADAPDLVIALEPMVLEATVRVGQSIDKPPMLCGVGSTSNIVSYLERGLIEAIAAQNDFAAGYLAVQAIDAAVAQRPFSTTEPIGFAIVRRGNMYDPQIQKLLFPFVR